MAKRQSRNPLAFTPLPVTIFTTAILAALFASLITIHNIVPPAPKNPAPVSGVNLSEAWLDLQYLSNGFHPYNSHRNIDVRNWLLGRIDDILARNQVKDFTTSLLRSGIPKSKSSNSSVHIYNDLKSSLVFGSPDSALSIAYTGENIIVYIRGSHDDHGMWWEEKKVTDGKGGVLVNAHFDSVPSGYGATDDGVGVVSVLQLISHFTTPGNTPKRGLVALLNNGEEDYLNGAYAFTQHPISKFPHTFLNLEGAGAGGRATLFRSTDNEVTRFYQKVPLPFGTVVSADGFKQHLVRSQTDYIIFNGELGMRGLDVAFMEPRSRYHTVEDSTKFTSKDSLWHMLSAAIGTLQGMTSDTTSTFDGKVTVEGGVPSGEGVDSVWFDLFGRVFAVIELQTMFAISVTLLVVTPLILILLQVLLVRADKWYPFSWKGYAHSHEDDDYIPLDGWKGVFRFPFTVVLATAATVGLAFLLALFNPYIVYSSQYAVWSMMLTAWLSLSWFLLRGADAMRPSALQRPFSLLWMYTGAYIVLAAVTVSENNFKVAGGYFIVFYFAAIFLVLFVSYLEFFALPKKSSYIQHICNQSAQRPTRALPSRPITAATHDNHDTLSNHVADEDATERTSLLGGNRSTFAGGYGSRARMLDGQTDTEHEDSGPLTLYAPFGDEQAWSGHLPRWTWLLQFLLLSIIPITLVGQVALLMTSALYQTPADGSPVLTVYLLMAVLSVLLLAPITPFLHRFHYPIPAFLFLICIGTMIYNLIAFPFSANSRLKVYFIQQVDLDSGINQVSLTGLMPYVNDIISTIPSARGRPVSCSDPDYTARAGLSKCHWQGIPPNVLNDYDLPPTISPEKRYSEWLSYNISRSGGNISEATISVRGRNTRACRILFDRKISDFNVSGFDTDPRFPRISKKGCKSIRLWSREWDATWKVHIKWDPSIPSNASSTTTSSHTSTTSRYRPPIPPGSHHNVVSNGFGNGLDGQIVCLWSDANDPSTIPAFTEIRRFMPIWSIATKLSDGLVEGSKAFKI